MANEYNEVLYSSRTLEYTLEFYYFPQHTTNLQFNYSIQFITHNVTCKSIFLFER